MPPTLMMTCPGSCRAEHQAFSFVHGYDSPHRHANGGVIDYIVFRCNRCDDTVTLRVLRAVPNPSWNTSLQYAERFSSNGYTVLSTIPAPKNVSLAPEDTPQNVVTCYEQGVRALDRGDFDVAGMGLRKSLDIATKHLIREVNPVDLQNVLGKNLHNRIEWLHSQNKLTLDMKEWAHIIRDEGNGAAHDETRYTKEDAEQLQHFAEVLLMYVFTIPAMVAKYRRP